MGKQQIDLQAIIGQLLQSTEPAIQWKVRVNVLGEKPETPSLQALQQQIKGSARVKMLLSTCFDKDGNLINRRVYAKWQGLHWVLASLADMGYPPGDTALIEAKNKLLDTWLNPNFYLDFEADSKAKAYLKPGVPVMLGRHRRCASQQGNALYMLLKLGLYDARLDELAGRLHHWQWPDGGWNCDKNPAARHSSFMETLLPLRGLALYTRHSGSAAAAQVVERAAEVFLKRRLFKKQSDGALIHPEFALLHYPLYWHYDVLGGLKILAEAGFINDARCNDALDLIESKQLPNGGWPAERAYYKVCDAIQLGADAVNWGGAGKCKMNEWVSVDALYVLKCAGRI